MDTVFGCTGFEWDAHNAEKNWRKHGVSPVECEQVFFNGSIVTASDPRRPDKELRFYSLGSTDAGRMIFVVFTVRGDRVRVISARDMSGKERYIYEKEQD